MPWRLSREIAKGCGADLERLFFWDDVEEFLRDDPDLTAVVVDSAQYLPRPHAGNIERLTRYARAQGSAIIWISQVNAKGKRKGGPALAHAVDIELTLRKNEHDGFCDVSSRKNRLQLPESETVTLALGAADRGRKPRKKA